MQANPLRTNSAGFIFLQYLHISMSLYFCSSLQQISVGCCMRTYSFLHFKRNNPGIMFCIWTYWLCKILPQKTNKPPNQNITKTSIPHASHSFSPPPSLKKRTKLSPFWLSCFSDTKTSQWQTGKKSPIFSTEEQFIKLWGHWCFQYSLLAVLGAQQMLKAIPAVQQKIPQGSRYNNFIVRSRCSKQVFTSWKWLIWYFYPLQA